MIKNNYKILISIIIGMMWIYFRKYENYRGLPNRSLVSTIFVGLWIWLNYKDPLFLPIGLFVLWLYSNLTDYKFSL